MTDDRWIVVPNWDKFQHYSDREPVWIKLYTELNSRAEWLQMPIAERGLLCTVWVEYARSRGQCTRAQVQGLCAKSARSVHWDSLCDAGLIQLSASKPSRARSREEEKKKKENARARASEKNDRSTSSNSKPADTPRLNMPSSDQAAYVRSLIANHVITEPYELDDFNLPDTLRAELQAML